MTDMASRAARRTMFDQATRLALLEDDVDSIERTGERVANAVNKLMIAVVGASFSLVIASVLLAADIARGR